MRDEIVVRVALLIAAALALQGFCNTIERGEQDSESHKQRDTKAHGVRYDDESKKRGAKLLSKKGATVASVSKELGISPRTLRRWAIEYKVDRPGKQRQFDRERILRLLSSNGTAEVAAKVGCSQRHVRAVRSGRAGGD